MQTCYIFSVCSAAVVAAFAWVAYPSPTGKFIKKALNIPLILRLLLLIFVLLSAALSLCQQMPFAQLEVVVRYRSRGRKRPQPIIDDTDAAAHAIRLICNKYHILWIEEVLLLCLK